MRPTAGKAALRPAQKLWRSISSRETRMAVAPEPRGHRIRPKPSASKHIVIPSFQNVLMIIASIDIGRQITPIGFYSPRAGHRPLLLEHPHVMTKHVECRRGFRVVWISGNLGEIEMDLGCCELIAPPEAGGRRVNAHGFRVEIEKPNRTLLVECLTLEHFRLETKRSLRGTAQLSKLCL
jgi:hypothetical protein